MKNKLVLPAFTVSLAVIVCFLFAACIIPLEPVNAGFLPEITEYELETFIPAPEAGESPRFSINAGFYTIQANWRDIDTNTEVKKGDKFKAATAYRAELTITAHQAFNYSLNPSARFTWQYAKDRIKDPENRNDRTVFLCIDFDRTGNIKISDVDLIGITAPQIDAAPVLSLDLGADAPYTAAGGKVEWSNDDGASFGFNGSFEEDKVYRARVTLNAKDGYTFNGLKPGGIVHNGRSATINPAAPDEDTTTITITIIFFSVGIEGINQVDLRGITSPIAGKAPSSAFALSAGANYTVSPVAWLEKDKPFNGNFKLNGNYDAQVKITPNPGFMFGNLKEEGRIIHNGRIVTITEEKDGNGETGAYLVTVHYDTLKADITELDLRGIPAPQTGVIARTNLNTSDFPFLVKSIAWAPLPPDGKFAGDTEYKAAVELEAETGYTFKGLTVGGVSDNGNDRDISPNPVPGDAVTVTVTITFDKTSPSNSGGGTNGDADGDGFPDGWETQYGYDPDNPADPVPGGDDDQDGLTNLKEYEKGTNPKNPDTDGDGFPDGWEVENGHDPLDRTDPDRNGDEDGDGFPNGWESDNGYDPLNPANPDTDGDGFPDDWENQYGYDPANKNDPDPNGDSDNDGLSNLKEYEKRTDPRNPDTDGDGFLDGWEVENGYNPLDPADPNRSGDKDGDGFPDGWEVENGHDPLNPADPDPNGDKDGDGFPNGWEAANGHDPLNPADPDPNGDEDGDGFPNGWEAANGHNPLNPADPDPNGDEDGDGHTNGEEVKAGTNPLDPKDHPGGGGSDNPSEPADQIVTLVNLTNLFDRPVRGNNPDNDPILTGQYQGSINWNHTGAFAPDTRYTAVLTLWRKPGYTFTGATGFSYSGALVGIADNTGIGITVAVVFPKTEQQPVDPVQPPAQPPVVDPVQPPVVDPVQPPAQPVLPEIDKTAQYGNVTIDGITWRVLEKKTIDGQRYALLLGPNSSHLGDRLQQQGAYYRPNKVAESIISQYTGLNAPTIKANAVMPANLDDFTSLDGVSSPTNQMASGRTPDIWGPAFALSYGEANKYRTAWRAAEGVNAPYGIALRTNVSTSVSGNGNSIYYAWPNTGTIKVQDPGVIPASTYIYVRLALWVKY